MSPIAINFSWEKDSRSRLLGVMLLLAGLAIAADTAWQYMETRTEMTSWQRDLQRLTQLGQEPTIVDSERDRERTKAELQIANRIIDELDAPWNEILNAVEVASVEHATLLSIDPNTERHVLRLHGEARDPAAVLAYLRSLSKSPLLTEVHLLSHQVSIQDPQRPVDFSISARWLVTPALTESSKAVVGEASP